MTPTERAAECYYFAMDGLPIDNAEAHIKVITAAITAAENDAIERCAHAMASEWIRIVGEIRALKAKEV